MLWNLINREALRPEFISIFARTPPIMRSPSLSTAFGSAVHDRVKVYLSLQRISDRQRAAHVAGQRSAIDLVTVAHVFAVVILG